MDWEQENYIIPILIFWEPQGGVWSHKGEWSHKGGVESHKRELGSHKEEVRS